MNPMKSEALKTCIEINNSVGTWTGEAWYDVYLCGRMIGTVVGRGRAFSRLRGVARTQGIDLDAARAAHVAAVEAEREAEALAAVPAIETAAIAPEPVKIVRELHPALRHCIAAFAATGLPTDAEGLRTAANYLLGLPAASRARLSVAQWELAALLVSIGERPRLAA